MSRALRAVAAAVTTFSALLEGCGPAANPPPASDNEGTVAELQARAEADVEVRRDADLCVPRSWRRCRVYYTDASGQTHCPSSAEVCRPGGRGWFPCGKYQLDDAGAPVLDELEASELNRE